MIIQFPASGWDIWQFRLWDRITVQMPDGYTIIVEVIGGQDDLHAVNVYYPDGSKGSYSLRGAVLQLPYPGSGDKYYVRIQNATYTPPDPAWGVPAEYQESWYAVPVYIGMSTREDGWPSDKIVPTRTPPLGIGESAGLALSSISPDAARTMVENAREGDLATIQSVQPELLQTLQEIPYEQIIQAQQLETIQTFGTGTLTESGAQLLESVRTLSAAPTAVITPASPTREMLKLGLLAGGAYLGYKFLKGEKVIT